MVRSAVLALAGLTLLASAGVATACPFGQTADTATTQQQTSDSQLPPPATGTTTETGSKTGG